MDGVSSKFVLIQLYRCIVLFQVIRTWGVQNNIDFLSLSCTRHAEDIRHVRLFPAGNFGSM